MPTPRIADIDLPDFGEPTVEPSVPSETYATRLTQFVNRLGAVGIDAAVIYGDREHSANIAWLSGYDPRFEEAILVVVPGRTPHLLIGNEGWGYAELARGKIERVLWQPLSLMGQARDRTRPLADLIKEAGVKPNMRIGIAGWKGYQREDGTSDPAIFEVPHYLVETLKSFGPVANIADILMNPRDGLRAINDVDQLASFEFAATMTSQALRNALAGVRPGLSELDVVRLMRLNGLPWSVHLMMSSGPRAKYGLPSPSLRKLERGDPVTMAFGVHGGLNARAGFLVADESELPAAIRDYVPKLVAPYFAAAAAWYETIGIGVSGAAVYAAVMDRIGDPFFGVGLNPGHLIHLDEWLHSPVAKNSAIPFASGMAVQCDIIPATGTEYFTSNIEDGIALADAELRRSFAAKYPEAWSRIERRRSFMAEKLGIVLKPEILPFSNMPGFLPPFWLSPRRAMTLL